MQIKHRIFSETRSIWLFVFIISGCVLSTEISAQTLAGQVTDTDGQPIPNATLYIRENAQGIAANENGEFQASIVAGSYTCDASSLGYEKKTLTISVPKEGVSIAIKLAEKPYSLSEVIVTPGKEDPAYRIMRNLIARAPYHLKQVKSYESEIYLKGSFKIDKIPALIKSQIKDKEFNSYIGKLLLYESNSEVKYSDPNNYDLRITAISSAIPQAIHISDYTPLSVTTKNIYNPEAFGGLLAPGSFSVYKFELEDSYRESELLIYKIRVIPRKKNSELVSGWLYVTDVTWTIQQSDLTIFETGATVRYQTNYNEIKPGAFLPTTFNTSMNLDLMGIKAGGHFYASVKYNQFETNDNYILTKTDTTTVIKSIVSDKKALTKKQEKDVKNLEELANKDYLTTREAYKMAQLSRNTIESNENIGNPELHPLSNRTTISRDSLVLLRDSSFWSKVRTVPLQTEELQSFIQRDSMKIVADSLRSADSIQNRSAMTWIGNIFAGERIKFGEKLFLTYEGILPAIANYNFVEGFRAGQRIEARYKYNKQHYISIAPAAYYVTARKAVNITLDGTLTYRHNGKLSASAGKTTADFAAYNGTSRFENTLGSLFLTKNTAKFYAKKYASLSNKVNITNGLVLTTGFNYENRHDLDNNTSFSFFGKNPASNRPHGVTDLMPAHKSYTADITIEYTPRFLYSMIQNPKRYRYFGYPTMKLNYKKGFSGGDDKNSSFDNIETTITQTIKSGLFNELFYEVNAGIFLTSKQTYLPDFKHFSTSEMFFTGKSFKNSFIMDNYRYATNDKWMQAHITYASQYILLKQIPFMQGYLFDEALHISTLWTPAINYNQVGYSLGLEDMRFGIFAGFNRLKYESIGITVSLPFLSF